MSFDNTVLSSVFTQYVFNNLIEGHEDSKYNAVIRRYSIDPSGKNNGQIISEIYCILSKSYRNEYFYQNTLLNKLLLGKHSLNTTTALTQIPINKSKADFILINGKAVVYEIKSELDSFERLETQLNDYYKAFNHVCVVTGEDNYDKIKTLLEGSPVGYYILASNNTFSQTMRKEPEECNKYLEHIEIFKILHKKEYESIVYSYFKRLPVCPQVFRYNECFSLFKTIPIEIAYRLTLRELKKRNRIIVEEYKKIPYELKSLIYFANVSKKRYTKINSFLQNEFSGGQ